MTPLLYVMTAGSATATPATEEVNPILGYKNPSGDGAFLLTGLVVNTSTGPALLQTRTDSQFVAGETLNATRPVLPVRSAVFAYEPTSNEMVFVSAIFPQDGQTDANNLLGVSSWPLVFNGTTYDQQRSNGAAVLAGATQPFGSLVAEPGEWSVVHGPAVGVQATATKAAGGAGVRHVCRSISFNVVAAALAQPAVAVVVRDGGTGAGTVLWQSALIAPVGTSDRITMSGLNIVGSANTAMTIEFGAAPAAGNAEAVTMSGYSTI